MTGEKALEHCHIVISHRAVCFAGKCGVCIREGVRFTGFHASMFLITHDSKDVSWEISEQSLRDFELRLICTATHPVA